MSELTVKRDRDHRSDGWADLCSEREAAELLHLSVATLRRRRRLRQPPVWTKLGARVFYRRRDLESFIESNVVCLPNRHTEDKP